MGHVIVTTRTFLWSMLTLTAALGMYTAVVTPRWLIGTPRSLAPNSKFRTAQNADANFTSTLPTTIGEEETSTMSESSSMYTPTVGIFNRCTRIYHSRNLFKYNCAPFINEFWTSSETFPGWWKASFVFIAIGFVFMTVTVCSSIVGCCIQDIRRKSIFTISGVVQAVAGLFFTIGLVLYPVGWYSQRVINMCGEESYYYTLGNCSLGWAFYLALVSTLATLACARLSVCADNSTSSDKVQDEISEGKNLICLL